MEILKISGGKPLLGEVEISGAKNSALKLIIASLFSSEPVYLSNVPKIKSIQNEILIMESLGSKIEWISNNYIKIDNSSLFSSIIPEELGKNLITSFLFAGPLLYRFGEVTIPLPDSGISEIEKFINTWASLNIEINFDKNNLYLKSDKSLPGRVEIHRSSHTATDNAILSSIFLNGETTIINSSEEIEIKDLINFCNLIGAQIEYENKRVLKISGQRHFKGAEFDVVSDLTEIVFFAVLALGSNGNIILKNIDKANLAFLVSFLNKIEANFEFTSNSELRIWKKVGKLKSFDIKATSFPGIISDFVPFFVILALFCEGESRITDQTYKDKFDFIYTLNKYGAKLKIFEGNKDFEECNILVYGPVELALSKIKLETINSAGPLFLASVLSPNNVEIINPGIMDYIFENVIQKVVKLGLDVKND